MLDQSSSAQVFVSTIHEEPRKVWNPKGRHVASLESSVKTGVSSSIQNKSENKQAGQENGKSEMNNRQKQTSKEIDTHSKSTKQFYRKKTEARKDEQGMLVRRRGSHFKYDFVDHKYDPREVEAGVVLEKDEYYRHELVLSDKITLEIHFGVQERFGELYHTTALGKDVLLLRDCIVNCFQYAWQSRTAKAVIAIVADYLKKDNLPLVLNLSQSTLFCHCERSLYWNPFGITWMLDYGISTETRNSRMNSQHHKKWQSVRPKDHSEATVKGGGFLSMKGGHTDIVLGMQSPAATLIHELGHFVQYITRCRQYFYQDLTSNTIGNGENHTIKTQQCEYSTIKDLGIPYEDDNLAWHEIPFCREMRRMGAIEGFRWHDSDAIRTNKETVIVKEIGLVEIKVGNEKIGKLVLRYKLGDSWYHANELWGCQRSSDQVVLKKGIRSENFWKEQNSMSKSLNKVTNGVLDPPIHVSQEVAVQLTKDGFLAPKSKN